MRLPKEIYDNILQLYNNGYNCSEIGEELKINRQTVARYLTSLGIDTAKTKAGKKYFYNNLFNKITNEEEAYWLGYLFADGTISNTENAISLGSIDKEHIEKFKRFIGNDNQLYIPPKQKETHSDYYRFKFASIWVKDNLIKLGCTPNKSLTLKCPSNEQVSDILFKHFVRGYLDGDGCVDFTTNSPRFNLLGTRSFLLTLQRRMNWENKEPEIKDNIFRLTYYGQDKAVKYLSELYDNSNIYLDRKYKKYLELKNK